MVPLNGLTSELADARTAFFDNVTKVKDIQIQSGGLAACAVVTLSCNELRVLHSLMYACHVEKNILEQPNEVGAAEEEVGVSDEGDEAEVCALTCHAAAWDMPHSHAQELLSALGPPPGPSEPSDKTELQLLVRNRWQGSSATDQYFCALVNQAADALVFPLVTCTGTASVLQLLEESATAKHNIDGMCVSIIVCLAL